MTLIAAETVDRVCHAIELDPLFVDVAVRRWQAFTGNAATLQQTGGTFDDVAAERVGETPQAPELCGTSPAPGPIPSPAES